jgi:hypothetical protein
MFADMYAEDDDLSESVELGAEKENPFGAELLSVNVEDPQPTS